MRGLTADVMPKEVENWLSPYLPRLLEKLDLGADNANAAALVRGLGPSSDVVVYGDYDVDGISATAIAMELALSKGAHVRYFIPHRFNQGYGLHKDVAQVIAKRKCDLVIVVDCGTQDVESVEILKKNGIPVVIFDHHLVEGKRAESDTLVNPQICGDSTAKRLCATAVLWCWIWQNELMPRRQLMKLLDVVALATIADCVSLSSSLNRALVREGINSIRSKARPGLNLLMEQLGISPSSIDTEDLAMRVIPCLNAAGRLYLADQDFYLNDEYDEAGLVLYSRHDKKYTDVGGSFTVWFEKHGEVNEGARVFISNRANGEYKEVKLDEVSGYYQIRNVQSNIYVKLYTEEGFPVANETIEATDARAYAQANKIVVITPEPTDVQIISMAGAVVATAQVAGQQEFANLAEGVYIVRMGNEIIKLQVRN